MDIDEFSDDGLDDLNETALQELENQAISFTQAQAKRQTQADYEEYAWEEDDDLDTSEVINDRGVPVGRPPVDRSLQPQQPPPQPDRAIPPPPNPRWNPSIDLTKRQNAGILGRQQFPQVGGPGRGGFAASQVSVIAARPQSSQFARPALPNRFAPSQAPASQSSQSAHDRPKDVTSALQQRVRALEAELNAARGEISIVRSKAEKQAQDHDAQVARLRRVNSDALAHHSRVAEAAVAAEKTASTELQFLQQDMREANTRQRRKRVDDESDRVGSFTTTPKKSKGWADGFDEMEIASPSKGQGRGRTGGSVAANVGERTPSKNKRKRPNFDSPVKPLDIHTGDDVVMMDKPEPGSSRAPQPSLPPPAVSIANAAPPFEFLQLVLDHARFHQQPPTFDILSRFAFPSDPGVSFATLIFQKLPVMGNPHRPIQLLVDFATLIIGLWAKCLQEEFWEPLKFLLALISFTFQLNTTVVAPLVIPSLVAVVQPTTWKVAEARQTLIDGDLSKNEEYAFLEEHINVSEILALLHTSALACITSSAEVDNGESEHAVVDLWRAITFDFVLLCLTAKQKPSDIICMLDLLATSSLPQSLGPITEDKEPTIVARWIIERVSCKLTEPSRYAASSADKRAMHTSALRTLIAFARRPFGAMQLVAHGNAIPRLVTCLSGTIDDLYDQPIPPNILPQPDYETPHEAPAASTVLHRIITQCVLLLHTLVTVYGAEISAKLSLSHGGSQRYLISLGRLTFAEEDLVMEAGIEGEVVEMAHELLEMAVTPDEGETISEAFGA